MKIKKGFAPLALGVGASLVGSAAAVGQDATAPQARAAAPVGIGDIVVTARRREESLQSVPVAVTAIGAAELQQRSTRDIADIANIAPNLQVGQATRGAGVANINLRGQENTGSAITNDPAVGVYFDEVYLGRSAGNLLASLQDMSSVQVLRGPQGTLFGRNNTGGAILLTPNRPELGGVHGSVNLNHGNFDHFEFGGVLDATLVEGSLGVRASFMGVRQDGIGRSLTTGADTYGNRHRDSGRVAARWQPSDTTTFDFTYDFTDINEGGPMQVPAGLAASTVNLPIGLGFYETRAGALPFSRAKIHGYTFRAEVEVTDDMALKTIIGRRKLRTLMSSDIDGGPAGTVAMPTGGTDTQQFARQGQWTAEVQLSGTTLRNATSWLNAINYTGGFFYFSEEGSDGSQVPNTTTALVTGRSTQNFARNESAAGYLQLESNHWDKLFLTFGTRFTKDKRSLRIRAVTNGVCSLRALPAGTPVGLCFQSAGASFSYWSFAAGARYQLNDQANVYFKYDKGQRAGGLDDTPTTIDPFFPEIVNSYEVGAKLDLFDRRLRTNLALFYATIDNLQRSSILVDPNDTPYASVFNAAKARTKGIELEVTANPVDGLTLSGSLGLIDAGYSEFTDTRPNTAAVIVNGQVLVPAVVQGADISDLDFANTPKMTWSLSGSYETQLGNAGSIVARVDYSHRSRHTFDTFNNPRLYQNGYGLLNARLQFNFADGWLGSGTSIAAYGRNLTNAKYSVFGSSAAGGLLVRSDQRRAYGVEFRAAF